MLIARVVSDTSPISNLAVIGRLDLLRRLYGTIIVPPAVRAELMRLRSAQANAAIQEAFDEGWIQVRQPSVAPQPLEGLHQGELECIELARQSPETLVLIDEAEGRAAARTLGFPITGVIGVLIVARRNGWIPSLKAELLSLRSESRFYIAGRLLAQALEAVGEAP